MTDLLKEEFSCSTHFLWDKSYVVSGAPVGVIEAGGELRPKNDPRLKPEYCSRCLLLPAGRGEAFR